MLTRIIYTLQINGSGNLTPDPLVLFVVQLLREKVQTCYLREGVNSMQNCKDIVVDYLESIKWLGMARMNSGRYDNPPPKGPLE